jgi:hypothetical protein
VDARASTTHIIILRQRHFSLDKVLRSNEIIQVGRLDPPRTFAASSLCYRLYLLISSFLEAQINEVFTDASEDKRDFIHRLGCKYPENSAH